MAKIYFEYVDIKEGTIEDFKRRACASIAKRIREDDLLVVRETQAHRLDGVIPLYKTLVEIDFSLGGEK